MLQLGLCWPSEFDGNFVIAAGVSDFKLRYNLETPRLKEANHKFLEFNSWYMNIDSKGNDSGRDFATVAENCNQN